MCASENNTSVKKRVYYEPDEDFYNSISAEEFRKELAVSMAEIDKIYAEKYYNERFNLKIQQRLTGL